MYYCTDFFFLYCGLKCFTITLHYLLSLSTMKIIYNVVNQAVQAKITVELETTFWI